MHPNSPSQMKMHAIMEKTQIPSTCVSDQHVVTTGPEIYTYLFHSET